MVNAKVGNLQNDMDEALSELYLFIKDEVTSYNRQKGMRIHKNASEAAYNILAELKAEISSSQ